jgi:hypothetical protein
MDLLLTGCVTGEGVMLLVGVILRMHMNWVEVFYLMEVVEWSGTGTGTVESSKKA